MSREDIQRQDEPGAINRRRFLATSAYGSLALATPALLSACGGSSSAPTSGTPTSAGASGTPKRGGTLNVGMITGGTSETLNPGIVTNYCDILRTYQLYDRLFEQSDDLTKLIPGLARSAEANAAGTVWTLHLRDGVEWHDGKPFDADDVVWTIRSWASKQSYANQMVQGFVDFSQVRKRGKLIVEVALSRPLAQLPSVLTPFNQAVIQNGATFKSFVKPVGTGPFKFVSFTPGRQSVFAANRNYWQAPKPYVDTLIVNSSFTDENARVNALLGGQINVAPVTPPTIAKEQHSSPQVTLLRAPSPHEVLFTMRVDSGPFADVRVRQAMRLLVDRPAMVAFALDGFGRVAYDLLGAGDEYYAHDLVRAQDVEKAKSLLRSAGQQNLAFTLPTSNNVPSQPESATLFAEQARAAGVNVAVTSVPSATYYGPNYLVRGIGQDDSGVSFGSLTAAYRTFFAPNGGFNTTHWGAQSGGAAAQKLLNSAMGATDPGQAQQLWREAQLQQFNEGGQLVWGHIDYLDLVAKSVHGLQAGQAFWLNNWKLLDGWVS